MQLVVKFFGAIDGRISHSISFSGPKLSRVVHHPPNSFRLEKKGDHELYNLPYLIRKPFRHRHFGDGFVDAMHRNTDYYSSGLFGHSKLFR